MDAFGNIGDDRPAWARSYGLPSKRTLEYAQTLTVATVGACLGIYLVVRTLRNPEALAKAARNATGA